MTYLCCKLESLCKYLDIAFEVGKFEKIEMRIFHAFYRSIALKCFFFLVGNLRQNINKRGRLSRVGGSKVVIHCYIKSFSFLQKAKVVKEFQRNSHYRKYCAFHYHNSTFPIFVVIFTRKVTLLYGLTHSSS